MAKTALFDIRSAALYQRRLLDAAVMLVKPGGSLVYSTCSLAPAENEANVRYALDTYPFMRLVPAEPILGGPGLVGGLAKGWEATGPAARGRPAAGPLDASGEGGKVLRSHPTQLYAKPDQNGRINIVGKCTYEHSLRRLIAALFHAVWDPRNKVWYHRASSKNEARLAKLAAQLLPKGVTLVTLGPGEVSFLFWDCLRFCQ